jgi:glutamyl-Q tRNA(Asp) synthetase
VSASPPVTPAKYASTVVTRFAPSPTGYLHLGHLYSARCGFDAAKRAGGRFLLRIEDLDRSRCRPEFTIAIVEDLRWAGLTFDDEVRRQSAELGTYDRYLRWLEAQGLLYPCFCSRAEIAAEAAAAVAAPHDLPAPGPPLSAIGKPYPGTCRQRSAADRAARLASGQPYALRLHVERALALLPPTEPLSFVDQRYGQVLAQPQLLGDVVLGRKELRTSYHLAVTVDDYLQGVTLVTRGEDLFHATHIHRLLQALFGFPAPAYAHHRLLSAADGSRLAKRRGAPTLRSLREAGQTPADLWKLLDLQPIETTQSH